VNNIEKQLEEAADALGKAMAEASPEVKKILRDMKEQVEKFVVQEAKEGKRMDASALFAAGIIAHPEILDTRVIGAAKDYIDTDYLFVKGMTPQEETAR